MRAISTVSIPHRVEGGGFAANAGEFVSVPAFILKLQGLGKRVAFGERRACNGS